MSLLVADGVRAFSWLEVSTAVYGTGWDGTTLVTASSTGAMTVTTER